MHTRQQLIYYRSHPVKFLFKLTSHFTCFRSFLARLKENLGSDDFQDQDYDKPGAIEVYGSSNDAEKKKRFDTIVFKCKFE